ncbi:hypothetical protein PYCCODRAFT_979485 [Trametes coccinea BRFM310]|uniref:Uncharacterized protein n=1 Tax=Trametes coccinea (strain BRFM310) TaxID=1353009 RepID=A0A1Y2IBX1_TRAC3|nr:hypothetical protein PYCCODRAFT_979485 [Trametes coccinea BRFM310]
MNFVRSHARSKSRSPAPRTPTTPATPQTSRPPTFYPPSHYAAAAGIPYPGDIQQTPRENNASFEHCPSMSSLSYPALEEPAVDSAEASSHFGAVGRLIGRSSSKRSTTSLSRSGPKGEKDAEAGDKRKSRLADIPLLETHLLPSLRDTVDRMTQLPRPSDEPPAAGSSHSRPPSTISSSRTFNAPADSPASTNIPRLRSKPSPAPKSVLKSPARRPPAPAVPSSAPQTYSRSMRTPQLPPTQPEGSQSESDTGHDARSGGHRARGPEHIRGRDPTQILRKILAGFLYTDSRSLSDLEHPQRHQAHSLDLA